MWSLMPEQSEDNNHKSKENVFFPTRLVKIVLSPSALRRKNGWFHNCCYFPHNWWNCCRKKISAIINFYFKERKVNFFRLPLNNLHSEIFFVRCIFLEIFRCLKIKNSPCIFILISKFTSTILKNLLNLNLKTCAPEGVRKILNSILLQFN